MLKSLTIKNYALIEELAAEFSSGLVILTGETGAGKSIIIDALSLAIGERASAEVIRSGAEKAVVEGAFSVEGDKKLLRLLEAHDISPGEEIIARREVSSRGQGRCFVNDTPVPLTVLKQIGDLLVDLHGQHEHQSLLRSDTHIELMDDFGGLEGLLAEYREAYARLQSVADELESLRQRERQLEEKRDFYSFQLQEIDAIAPRPGEDEELSTELRILENAEGLFSSTATMYDMLYGGERSIRDLLVLVRNQCQDLSGIDRQFAEAAKECASAEAIVDELAKFVQTYNARVEFNPERLEEVRERLGRIEMLKKKYGGSLEAVIARRGELAAELSLAENYEEVMAKVTAELEKARSECAVRAGRLSSKRYETARRVDRGVLQELKALGIEHGRFSTRIEQTELGPGEAPLRGQHTIRSGKKHILLNERGIDSVEFFLSANMGEEERPLARVASGGEISRIMLALKSVLAKSDRLPALVFDEIDVGVSGRIAQAVGMSLKALSTFHQVIAITHLPQIAGLADTHFLVVKSERKGRARTSLRKLSLDEQVEEVARLMSGSQVTKAGLAGARELMGLR
jgi:DNA repair protein RecN (Recombination protein N)